MALMLRTAVQGDVPALLALEQETLGAAHWTEEQYQVRVSAGIVLIAEKNGSLCGFLCARAVKDEWEIENVVVATCERRCGIASQLLAELLERAQSQVAGSVWLEVRESNEPARRLYEKHRFREAARRCGYYKNPSEDAVTYCIDLHKS
jgi:ribosomal-protein-alanine N-acetyltransferase